MREREEEVPDGHDCERSGGLEFGYEKKKKCDTVNAIEILAPRVGGGLYCLTHLVYAPS